MKIAFISDIHSNYEALKSVLCHIDGQGMDRIYCLGDMLGYLDRPNEVVDLIRARKIQSIIGNNDEDIVFQNFKGNKIKEWTYSKLTSENIRFVRSLPKTMKIEAEDNLILLVHGSPKSSSEYLYEGEENTLQVLSVLEEDILVAAHTHIPYIDFHDYKMIINCGSVGKPKFGSPNASYALLDLSGDDIKAEIMEVEYDVEAAAASLEVHNFPEALIEEIKTGGRS